MAVHRPPILGRNTWPDSSGSVGQELTSVMFTNDLFPQPAWRLKDTATRIWVNDRFVVPSNFNNSPKAVIDWTTTVITGAVSLSFAYHAANGTDSQTVDPAAFLEEVVGTTNAPSSALRLMRTTIALTGANFSPDAFIQFQVARRGDLGTDTMVGDIYLLGARFEYQDT